MAEGNLSDSHDGSRPIASDADAIATDRRSSGATVAETHTFRTALSVAVARDLVQRCRGGVLAYACLGAILAMSTTLPPAHRSLGIVAVVVACLLGVVRLYIATSIERIFPTHPRRWMTTFRTATLFASSFWGVVSAAVVWLGLDANALVVLLPTAGVAAGGTVSLSSDLALVRAFVASILLPIVVACVHAGSAQGYGTAAAILLFLAFLQVQGGQLHRDFVAAVESKVLLEERAIALEKARNDAVTAQKQAAAASAAKTEFLANLSHEIRTPMTAMLGYAELLDGPVTELERAAAIATIKRNGEHLVGVLDDVLDLSSIEINTMTTKSGPCDLVAILLDLEAAMQVGALERRLTFRLSLENAIPRTIVCDEERLRQILDTIVGSAIKSTTKGTVTVTVRFAAEADAGARLLVEVADTSFGMTAEQLEQVVQPFGQTESVQARRPGGADLKLALSRRLARLLGGDLHVWSKPGRGSVLTLELPATENSTMCTTLETPVNDVGNVRILLAEDSAESERLASAILARAGAIVEVVRSGNAAVRRAQDALANGAPFDVILMDMDMPDLDGFTATRVLRAGAYCGPILAFTAHEGRDDRARCIAAGCDAHLSKPFNRERMLATIARVTRRGTSRASVAPPWDPNTPLTSTYADDPAIRPLLDAYLDDLVAHADAIVAALEKDDRKAIARLAHALAGSGGGYGFASVTDAAHAVEAALASGPRSLLQTCARELVDTCRRASASRRPTPTTALAI